MTSFRIWRELWRCLLDFITGRDPDEDDREQSRLYRLGRQAERKRQWEREKRRRRDGGDFKSLCEHTPVNPTRKPKDGL